MLIYWQKKIILLHRQKRDTWSDYHFKSTYTKLVFHKTFFKKPFLHHYNFTTNNAHTNYTPRLLKDVCMNNFMQILIWLFIIVYWTDVNTDLIPAFHNVYIFFFFLFLNYILQWLSFRLQKTCMCVYEQTSI